LRVVCDLCSSSIESFQDASFWFEELSLFRERGEDEIRQLFYSSIPGHNVVVMLLGFANMTTKPRRIFPITGVPLMISVQFLHVA
jgi:hypothetical protein